MTRSLLAAGVYPNAPGTLGAPPFFWATLKRNPELIQIRKNAGAKTDTLPSPAYPGPLPENLLRP